MRRATLACSFGALLALAAPAGAQRAPREPDVAVMGARVRLQVEGRRDRIVGWLQSARANDVTLLPCDRCAPAVVRRDAILAVQRRTTPSRGRELLAGVIGAAVGARIGQSMVKRGAYCGIDCREDGTSGFLLGALVGGGAGLTFGAFLNRERWVAARLPGQPVAAGT